MLATTNASGDTIIEVTLLLVSSKLFCVFFYGDSNFWGQVCVFCAKFNGEFESDCGPTRSGSNLTAIRPGRVRAVL